MDGKMILSPITGEKAIIIEKYRSSEFIRGWEKSISIDVSREFANINVFYKCLCQSSQYEFFFPFELEGSTKFYENLSKCNWYYMANKWEHKTAIEKIEILSDCHKVLEIGCGFGDFLDLCASYGIDGMGIDLNQEAIAYGKSRWRNVEGIALQELENRMQSRFDAVVVFQVLEHIADPLPFIRSCVNLLSPGGTLILTVPDGHGFCGRTPQIKNIFDSPPHHMGKWNIAAFQYLTKIFSITLNNIIYEPLQEYHLGWYISEMLSNEGKYERLDRKIIKKMVSTLLTSYVKAYGIYHRWKGHTLFVKFTKSL
jgi:SAM-dependent methyltransferase